MWSLVCGHVATCRYLREKDVRIRETTLPVEGRNKVLYLYTGGVNPAPAADAGAQEAATAGRVHVDGAAAAASTRERLVGVADAG